MIARLLFFLLLVQPLPPRRFHAYQLSANGRGVADPEKVRYVPCDVEVIWKGNQLFIGPTAYNIYTVEHPTDSVTALFAIQPGEKDHVYLSAVLVPMKEKNHWQVLVTWEDSTKAYKTIAR